MSIAFPRVGQVIQYSYLWRHEETASSAVEIPRQVKKQLGFDDARSWIVTSEYNVFRWPGYDLAPVNSGSIAVGTVPSGLLKLIIASVRRHAVEHRLASVSRDLKDDPGKKP